MNRVKKTQGFTIVEVIIFLGITSILFVSAVVLLSGQQNRTQFSQSINDTNSQLGQIVDSIANGFSPNFNNAGCTASPGGSPTFNGTAPQGSNTDCVFLGKVLQLDVQGTDPQQLAIYTIAGLRQINAGQGIGSEPASYTDAKPTAVPAVDTTALGGGLTVSRMDYIDDSGTHPIGSVAFLSSLSGGSSTGTQSVNLVPIPNSVLNDSQANVRQAISSELANPSAPINPWGGVEICFNSGTTNQSALVTIGNNGRTLSTNISIQNGPDCPDPVTHTPPQKAVAPPQPPPPPDANPNSVAVTPPSSTPPGTTPPSSTPPGTTGPPPPPLQPSTTCGPGAKSIGDYINTAAPSGVTEVVVPDGCYVGGNFSVSHGGWLILKAATPGSVTVDLSGTGFQLHDADFKVVFAGMHFVNGLTGMFNTSNIDFWYDDFTFPPDVWDQQYTAVGGVFPVTASNCDAMRNLTWNVMPNFTPTSIRTDGGNVSNIGLYGSDIHDDGDDGAMFYGVSGFQVQGVRIWNIGHTSSQDPAAAERQCSPYGGDWWHSDAFQSTGNGDVHVDQSWFGQDIEWETAGAMSNDSFTNMWIAGSEGAGAIMALTNSQFYNNVYNNIRAFANGQGHLGDSGWNIFRIDYCGQYPNGITWPGNCDGQQYFDVHTSNIDLSVPAGVNVDSSGALDINSVKDNGSNPANIWRSNNPYGSLRSVLGI